MARSSWRRVVTPAVMLMASVSLLPMLTGGSPAASSTGATVLTAAGDIDGCGPGKDTAGIIDGTGGVVAALGDNAYPGGSPSDFAQCYGPTWGRFKDRTRPVPGNHDYDMPHASGYFGFFGAAAGPAGTGYYSYDVGGWHIVALNSNCSWIDCDTEGAWLNDDLTAHPAPCTLAYWHHPRFSSGSAGDNTTVSPFWKVLYDHNASVVLAGHDHDYERFAPQNPDGRADPGRGIREFIVGTGGGALGSLYGAAPNSEVRNNRTFGVLELTLRPDGYDWRFAPVAGSRFSDSGSDKCSGATAAVTTTATSSTAPAAGSAPPPTTTTEPAAAAPGPTGSSPTDSAPAPTPAGPTSTRPVRSRGAAAAASPPSPPPKPATTASPTPPSWSPPPTPGPAPELAPAPAPAGPADDAPVGPPADRGIGGPAASPAPPIEEAAPLPAAIAGLIGTTPGSPHSGSDRRGVATVALMLMLVDCAGIAALHRGRPSATLVGSWYPALLDRLPRLRDVVRLRS